MASTATKLTASIVATASAIVGLAFSVWQLVATSPAGINAAILRRVEQKLAPAWPDMVDLYRVNAPPGEIELPAGDPRATLARVLTYPLARQAFHLGPDLVLTVIDRGPQPPQGPYTWPSTYVVDLKRWRPQHLNLDPEIVRARERDDWRRLAARTKERHEVRRRERWIASLLNDGVELFAGDRDFAPLPPRTLPFFNYAKGDTRRGVLGFELDVVTFGQRSQAILARHGAGADAYWDLGFLGDGLISTALIRPSVPLPPQLRYLVAMPNGDRPEAATVEVFTWYGGAGLLALLASVLGLRQCLRHIRAMLEERALAVAKGNFVSAVSHEMRTPLTTIKMYADMIEAGIVEEPAKRQAYMRTISQECDRLTRLIENVLDYAKISGRSRQYAFAPVEVGELVDAALTSLRAPLAKAGVTPEVVVPGELRLEGDRDALVQALVNLVGNALKYAPGEKRILVTAEDRGETIALAVRDFGPGIAPGEQARVFQPFYRIGNELTRSATGSGLGLALVAEYARAHGGKVELESAPGEGATFRLLLPKRRCAA